MAVQISLLFPVLALCTLAWARHSSEQRKAVHFGVGVAFAGIAAVAMVMFAIRSLWLYPL